MAPTVLLYEARSPNSFSFPVEKTRNIETIENDNFH